MNEKPETAPRICAYCGHVYVKPCDGADATCENKKWIDKQKEEKK